MVLVLMLLLLLSLLSLLSLSSVAVAAVATATAIDMSSYITNCHGLLNGKYLVYCVKS